MLDNQASTLLLTVDTRLGAMFFDVRVSSEAGWDFLEFYINGVRVERWSGEVPWQSVHFNLPAGRNHLLWRYVKDANFSAGLDAAFLDNIYVPLTMPDLTPAAASLAIYQLDGQRTMLQVSGKTGLSYVVQASADLSGWVPISTNLMQGTSVFVEDPQDPAAPHRFYRAITP